MKVLDRIRENRGTVRAAVIMVDATHVKANATAKRPTELLREMTKKLRLEIYKSLYELSERFPDKPSETADLSEKIEYSKKLLEAVDEDILASGSTELKSLRDQIKELLLDERIRRIRSVTDKDAKYGHKSQTNSFFGYKAHIAMTEERLISAVLVTSGEACDGDVMRELAEDQLRTESRLMKSMEIRRIPQGLISNIAMRMTFGSYPRSILSY